MVLPTPAADDMPVGALLRVLLDRISSDIPGVLGAALSVAHGGKPVAVLLASGVAEYLAPAQAELFGGPIPDAAATGEPVLTDDLFADPRWPRLTRDALAERCPQRAGDWAKASGAAALPGLLRRRRRDDRPVGHAGQSRHE